MADGDHKSAKIERASTMLEKSPAFQLVLPMSAEEWAGVLAKLDEDKIDDYLLILDEEKGTHLELKKEEKRKLQTNRTRYLQRLERLKVKAKESINKTDAA
ncbi:hypothetical protein A3J23_00020 [Candidatus Peregrinibacteria bacterium RIFCSPLOWO2_02_FULL_48_14]|nr:MAG: hypothetical protein A3J23_00020 [Candidatus Peregrinibacteria bacterium RIFCSPLOWO2_02_FULL_48_14]